MMPSLMLMLIAMPMLQTGTPQEELAQPALTLDLAGPMDARVEAVVEHWVLPAPAANPGMLEMFRLRDREPPYPDPVWWAGEFAGKYLTSAVLLNRMSQNKELPEQLKEFVPKLIATQADNGYFGPFSKDEQLLGAWDLWGHYHIMYGLWLWHEETGDPSAREAVLRAADLICDTYLDTDRRVHDAGWQEMNMAVIHILGIVYRDTGNERYLRLMREIEQDWQKPPAGDYYRQAMNDVPFYKTPKPRWESLHVMQGLGELYRITGEESYREALLHYWYSIRETDIHNAGSFSTNEGAVGNPFKPGAIETCCTIAWIAYSIDALRLSGDARVADAIELATWNSVLGLLHPSGRWCTYNTPMDGRREASAHTIVFQSRAGTPELNCCSVNGPRGLGMLSEWAVLGGKDGLYLNYYGPGSIEAKVGEAAWRLAQETGYPRSGKITIRVEPPSDGVEMPLYLRIPEWSKETVVRVNGEAVGDVQPGQYLALKRSWSAGDSIELTLDMGLRALRGDHYVDFRTSLFKGPLLLAYDQHFSAKDPAELPTLDLATLSLEPVQEQSVFEPIMLLRAEDGSDASLKLVDYATAGATGTVYHSWLPVENAPPAPFFLDRPEQDAKVGEEALFSWAPAAPEAEYRLVIARDRALEDVVHELKTDETQVLADVPLEEGQAAYWQVFAKAEGGQAQAEARPRKFTRVEQKRGAGETVLHWEAPLPDELEAAEVRQDVPLTEGPGAEAEAAGHFNGETSKLVYDIGAFPTKDYTFAAWIYPEAPMSDGGYHHVVSAWAKSFDDPLRLTVISGGLLVQIEQQGSFVRTAPTPIEAGKWQHAAVVKEGGKLRLYLDGKFQSETRVPPELETSSTKIGIGCNPLHSDLEGFTGKIAGAQLHSFAFTDAEVYGLAQRKGREGQ